MTNAECQAAADQELPFVPSFSTICIGNESLPSVATGPEWLTDHVSFPGIRIDAHGFSEVELPHLSGGIFNTHRLLASGRSNPHWTLDKLPAFSLATVLESGYQGALEYLQSIPVDGTSDSAHCRASAMLIAASLATSSDYRFLACHRLHSMLEELAPEDQQNRSLLAYMPLANSIRWFGEMEEVLKGETPREFLVRAGVSDLSAFDREFSDGLDAFTRMIFTCKKVFIDDTMSHGSLVNVSKWANQLIVALRFVGIEPEYKYIAQQLSRELQSLKGMAVEMGAEARRRIRGARREPDQFIAQESSVVDTEVLVLTKPGESPERKGFVQVIPDPAGLNRDYGLRKIIREGWSQEKFERLCSGLEVARYSTGCLEPLRVEFPWFQQVIDQIERELQLSAAFGDSTIRFRPLLLVGAPGVGKSKFCARLAECLGVPSRLIAVGGQADNRSISGTSRGFASATPSEVVQTLAEGVFNPLIVGDELSRASANSHNGSVFDVLLSLLEHSTAIRFNDGLLGPVNCSGVCWVLTSNGIKDIPEALLSRMTVILVEQPSKEHYPAIIENVRKSMAARWGCDPRFLPALTKLDIEFIQQSCRSVRSVVAVVERIVGDLASAEIQGMCH